MVKAFAALESFAGDLIEYVNNRVEVLKDLPMLNEGQGYELEWGSGLLERGTGMGIIPMINRDAEN